MTDFNSDVSVDWDQAPEGTTHYSTCPGMLHRWLKHENGNWYFRCYSFNHGEREWTRYFVDSSHFAPEYLIERPVVLPLSEDVNVIWDQAPEGTTHYSTCPGMARRWLKYENGNWYFRCYSFSRDAEREWTPYRVPTSPEYLIERPVVSQHNEDEVQAVVNRFREGRLQLFNRDERSQFPEGFRIQQELQAALARHRQEPSEEPSLEEYTPPIPEDNHHIDVDVDWDQAPEGTTHFTTHPRVGTPWLMQDENGNWSWYSYSGGWIRYTTVSPHTQPQYTIARPLNTNTPAPTPVKRKRTTRMEYFMNLRKGDVIDWAKVPAKIKHIILYNKYPPIGFNQVGDEIILRDGSFSETVVPLHHRRQESFSRGNG